MTLYAHGSAAHGADSAAPLIVALVLVGASLVYVTLAVRRRREMRGWSLWRVASFVAGAGLLVAATRPSTSEDFGDHMLGHLVIGMFAPMALVLAAPVTLILRSVPPRAGKAIVHVLRSRPARIATHPVVLLTANIGGLALLYFTPLYSVMTSNTLLHSLVHIHFFVAGYLFAWLIAGPDPGPHRPPVPTRIVVLGIAVLGHSIVSQLIYAGLFVQVPATAAELRDAGTLMYYWGDIAEILLAVAMLLTWHPVRRSAATYREAISTSNAGSATAPPRDVEDVAELDRLNGSTTAIRR